MASYAANFLKLFTPKSCQMVTYNLLRASPDLTQVRNYAARKGTRERKLKLLRAQKTKKQSEKPKEFKKKKLLAVRVAPVRIREEQKPLCIDDVEIGKFYRWRVYDFAEAIQCHRETHHPTVYNRPDSYVQAHIELDMTAVKKDRYVEEFTRLVRVPHIFPTGEERSILVFCKTEELQKEAEEAGAKLVGDLNIIKEIEKGDFSVKDFDHVLAHPNIIPDMVPIRGLMKKVFPNIRSGTLGTDLKNMVAKFRHGVQYKARRNEQEQDYGLIEVHIGKLDMEVDHLQENLQVMLRDVYSVRPKRPGPFITRVILKSAPSREMIKLDLAKLLPEQAEQDQKQEEDSDEDEENEQKELSTAG